MYAIVKHPLGFIVVVEALQVDGTDVLWTAAAYVLGLLSVVLAQGAAFLTLANLAQADIFFASEQFQRAAALQFSHQSPQFLERMTAADTDRANGSKLSSRADVWRLVGILFFVVSLIEFVVGCVWGATVVILAKEVASRQ